MKLARSRFKLNIASFKFYFSLARGSVGSATGLRRLLQFNYQTARFARRREPTREAESSISRQFSRRTLPRPFSISGIRSQCRSRTPAAC